MRNNLVIKTAPRFLKAFESGNTLLKKKVYDEVHQFVRTFNEDPITAARHYKTFSGVEPYTVLEFRVDYRFRALGHWEKQALTLVDLGNHDHVYAPFTRRILESQLADAKVAEKAFFPESSGVGGIFGSMPNRQFELFENEASADWIFFLTESQTAKLKRLVRKIKNGTLDIPHTAVIVGGPGTGKTTILSRLHFDLLEKGLNPGLVVSDRVAKYLESGGHFDISKSRLNRWELYGDKRSSFDVALVDDPDSADEIFATMVEARGRFKAVVIAFDPCQLSEDVSDVGYKDIQDLADATHVLSACYRQKETVGRAAMRVIKKVAESTPFLADEKIRQFRDAHEAVYEIANGLTFPNKWGYEETHIGATRDQLTSELRRIKKRSLWQHTPAVLVVVEQCVDVGSFRLKESLGSIEHEIVEISSGGFRSLMEIKGVEYQHAFFIISNKLYRQLTDGFEGVGKKVFHQRRLLRIPFSRAKDSIVTFVVADSDGVTSTERVDRIEIPPPGDWSERLELPPVKGKLW